MKSIEWESESLNRLLSQKARKGPEIRQSKTKWSSQRPFATVSNICPAYVGVKPILTYKNAI